MIFCQVVRQFSKWRPEYRNGPVMLYEGDSLEHALRVWHLERDRVRGAAVMLLVEGEVRRYWFHLSRPSERRPIGEGWNRLAVA